MLTKTQKKEQTQKVWYGTVPHSQFRGKCMFYRIRSQLTPNQQVEYNQSCGSGMFIPEPIYEFFPSRIRIKELKKFNPKNGF
jgi:hypothetical protein